MLNKLQYLGKVDHRNMSSKKVLFASNKELPFCKVFYKMVKWDGAIYHQWFISQNKELAEDGYVNTYHKYVSVNRALDEMLGEWRSV